MVPCGGDETGTLPRVVVDRIERLIVALGAAMLAANLVAVSLFPKQGGRLISGDAIHHYVQLRSLVFDHDLDFANEYTRLFRYDHPHDPEPRWRELLPTPTGLVRTYMPVGPAILWAPLYLVVSGGLQVAAWAGWAATPDGFEPVLQLVPNVTGVAAATIGAWLAWRIARRLTDRRASAAAVLAIWLGSPALYYTLVAPSYSHAASMLASALIVLHWLDRRDRWRPADAAVSGLLVGVAALMRWQDALWFAVPAIESLRQPGRPVVRAASVAAAAAGCLLAFSPQMAVWRVLYGSPLTVPQGSSFMEWTAPNLAAVLVAAKHGLFTWSPMLVPAVIGLFSLARRHRPLALPLGAVALASWYVNAAVWDWWAGEAFGARRFLSLFPLFVAGLAAWLQPALEAGRRFRPWLVAFLVAANLLFLFQYQVFMRGWRDIAPYPDESWIDLWLMRFVVPFRVLAKFFT